MAEFESKIIEIIPRTDHVKSFRVKMTGEVAYDPGQYLFVSIDVKGRPVSKPLSFSSSPTEKGYIEFTKKITDSDFSGALDAMHPGDPVSVKMPFGKFTFKGELLKIALLSGGIGITPFRSVCKYACDSNSSSSIVLLYGNNSEKDIVFKTDFDIMEKENEHFRAVYALTDPGSISSEWKGCTGIIDSDMIKTNIQDYNERTFFLCGPPGMVGCLLTMLKSDLNVSDDRIRTENFAGY